MTFIANAEAPELVDPGKGALDDPAVSPEALAALDAAAGNARFDPTGAKVVAAAFEVVAFVGVELRGPFAGSPARLTDRVDRVDGCRQGHAVVPVGPGQDEG